MSQEIGSIHYDLDLQENGFKGKVKGAQSSMQGLTGSFKNAEGASKALLVSIGGLALTIVGFGIKSVIAYKGAQTAQAQLAYAVDKVSHATTKQLTETEKLIDAIERKGVIDGDALKVGVAQLSTFGLSNKAVQGLTKSLADLAVNQNGVNVSGEQAAETANMIAKALNGQFGVLEKSGIRFTDAQIRMVKYGTEMQKVKAINEGFQQNLKFTNDTARQTSDGIDAHLLVSLGNIQEDIGKTIDDGLKPFRKELGLMLDDILSKGPIIDQLTKFINDNEEAIYTLAGAITIALLPALVSLGLTLVTTVGPILPFLAVGALLGKLIFDLVQKLGGWDEIMKRLQPTLTLLGNIVQFVIVPYLQSLWEQIQTQLIPALQELWKQVSPILIPVLKVLGAILGGTLFAAITIVAGILKVLIEGFAKNIKSAAEWIEVLKDIGKKINEAFKPIEQWIKDALKNVKDAILKPFTEAFDSLKKGLDDIKGKISDALNPYKRHSPSLVDWMTKGANEMVDIYSNMFDQLGSISSKNRLEMSSAIQTVSGAVQTGSNSNVAAPSSVTVNVSPTGIIGRSPGEVREIALDLADMVKQALNASGARPNIIR